MDVTARQPDGLFARAARFFPDHEIYIRSGGQMRFLRITTTFQMKLAAAALLLFAVWLISSIFMVGMQIKNSQDRELITAQQTAVDRSAGRIADWRSDVDGLAQRLEQRQAQLDQMMTGYFGDIAPAPAVQAKADTPAVPEAAPLARVEARQQAFAERLTLAAGLRAREAEKAIRSYGINPAALTGSGGVGGPFIPIKSARGQNAGFQRLATSLRQLDQMERALLAIPNTAPATPVVLSSGFGVRSDPFNGSAALHAGLDITGDHGQAIYAAAAGRVITVGQQGGYGNLVVIDHGHGIQTRYGHLSGFDVRPGQLVTRGQQIARMGSTGRSTGDHLHFEVRMGERAINPRPFLEGKADVLKVQTDIQRRFGGR